MTPPLDRPDDDPPVGGAYDAIVVGARVAGAATAMLLARAGLSVLAVDRSPYGSDTLSTHALVRGGMVQLARWGLLDRVRATGVAVVRRATFYYGDDAVPFAIPQRDGVDWFAAPRRTDLDALLADEARRAGATVWHGPRVNALVRGRDGRVLGVDLQTRDGSRRTISASLVIGADGAQSTVARDVGAQAYRVGSHGAGVVYGYWLGLEPNGYEWLFGRAAAGGRIPTSGGATCVFAACPAARFMNEIRRDLEAGYFRLLNEVAPALSRATASARPLGRLRGFPGIAAWMRQSHGPGWALVGDAGYFKDPITAHGITDAFRDAELLVRAVLAGSDRAFSDYQTERDDLSHELFDITDAIASFAWDFPQLQALHRSMSRAVNRESAHLAGLGPLPAGPARQETPAIR